MGLETNNRAIYLSIGEGKITRRVNEPTGKSKQRTTKEGRVVNEEIYDAISGHLIDIKVTTHEKYGKFWAIYLKDGEDVFCLQTNYSGSYASAFLKALPNADLTERVKLIPYMKIVDGKEKPTLFISQGGHALKHFYTKEEPKGLPQMVQRKVKGQMVWDDTDMLEFLEKMVMTEIVPKLPKSGTAQPANSKDSIEGIEVEAEEINTNDLPF